MYEAASTTVDVHNKHSPFENEEQQLLERPTEAVPRPLEGNNATVKN